MEIDAGVVAAMMEDAPHVGVDSAEIEDVVQALLTDGRDEMALWLLSWAMFSKRNVWARPPKSIEGNKVPGTGMSAYRAIQDCPPGLPGPQRS
jgi:hypothetical protein